MLQYALPSPSGIWKDPFEREPQGLDPGDLGELGIDPVEGGLIIAGEMAVRLDNGIDRRVPAILPVLVPGVQCDALGQKINDGVKLTLCLSSLLRSGVFRPGFELRRELQRRGPRRNGG